MREELNFARKRVRWGSIIKERGSQSNGPSSPSSWLDPSTKKGNAAVGGWGIEGSTAGEGDAKKCYAMQCMQQLNCLI